MHTLGNIFHVNFLGYANWFMSVIVSEKKDHSFYVDQARYAIYILAKYLDTATVKTSTNICKTTFPSDIILIKYDKFTSDEQIEKVY